MSYNKESWVYKISKVKRTKNLQTEIDACFLYEQLAKHESDPVIQNVFRQMSAIEKSHAAEYVKTMEVTLESVMIPSWRAKILNTIGKVFGYNHVLASLMETEKSLASAVVSAKKKQKMDINGREGNHVDILRSILEKENNVTGAQFSKIETKHNSVGGNAIRAAVLGGTTDSSLTSV